MARRKQSRQDRKRAAPRSVRLERTLAAVPQEAERALQDVLRALGDGECACGDLDEIRLALREALNNALHHGSKLDPRKHVHVTCRCDPSEGLEITLCDEGKGFDPDGVPDPTTPEGLDRFSGRGLYMIRRLMDEVEFSDGGRCISMRRRPRGKGFGGS